MTDDDSGISRRNVLTALATAGTVGALGGAGTYALFSDRERMAVSFTSGKLDLAVHYESTYNGATTQTNSGTINGGQEMLFNLDDLKPGDSGETKFCFDLHTNPAYLWLCGMITADDEGKSHSQLEQEAGDDSPENGELDEAIKATLRYCDSSGNPGGAIVTGPLRDVLTALENGVPLDFGGDGGASAKSRAPYEPGEKTGPCVCIEWKIPKEDVDNEIQTDTLDFSLVFHAVQARHNDGTESPCGDTDSTGDTDGTSETDDTSTCENCVQANLGNGQIKNGDQSVGIGSGQISFSDIQGGNQMTSFDFTTTGVRICEVEVKGQGNAGTKTYDYRDNPVTSGDDLHAPGESVKINNVDIYYCAQSV